MFGNGFFGFGDHMGHDDAEPSGEKDTKLYEILGIPQTATTAEVRKAYKKMAMKFHPDKGGDPEKFKEISMANEVLSNEEKRKLYDKYGLEGLKEGAMSGGAGGAFDIFEQFFGGGHRKSGKQGMRKGKAVLKEVSVSLEDVYVGKLIKVPHVKKGLCQTCDGAGGKNVKTCTTCKGRGVIEKLVMLGPGMYSQTSQHCKECKGEGKIMNEKDLCKTCKGQKVVTVKKNLEVVVEPGVPHDKDIIFYGEGDEFPGVMGGDIHARIKIEKHKVFTRKGADLFMEKKITLLEALTGFRMEISHLNKQKIKVCSLPNEVISDGIVKTLKGMGMPFFNDNMSHGNLYVKFSVQFPKKGELDNDQMENLKKILPGPNKQPFDKKGKFDYLEDFDETELNTNAGGGHNKEEEEGEEDYRGGQRVGCNQQ